MVKQNSWLQIFKGIGIILLLTMFWLLLFAALDTDSNPENINYEPFNGASIVFGILTYLVLLFIFQYNKVIHLKSEIQSSFNAISIKQQHVASLISQLREVTDKIVDHELKMSIKNTFSELVEEDKSSENVTSDMNQAHHHNDKKKQSSQSGSTAQHEHISQVSDKVTKLVERIERDTKGSADQSLHQLMAEIKESEALVANQRLYYNETVSQYNKAIYALPLGFLRMIFGFVEQPYA